MTTSHDTERASSSPLDRTLAADGGGNVTTLRPSEVRALGRYLILSQLGSGGMGAVYLAYDPELHRKIAIKLLKSNTAAEAERARLLREAQAMAKLSHPNVVSIYDVGIVEGQVFVAMEFVKGGTLRTFIDAQPRSWRDIVLIYIQAARGLAAAHRANLVHRDFKPDNVLVSEEGWAKVSDFGLVRTAAEGNVEEALGLASTQVKDARGKDPLALTQTGALLGTPLYMSPEQFLRGTVDGRSDQFSFFVSLFEALYRVRPFVGSNVYELAASVSRGERVRPKNDAVVPRRIRAIVDRGLETDPLRRWATMDQVAALLESGVHSWIRRHATALLAVLAATSISVATASSLYVSPDKPGQCEKDIHDRWAKDWSAERREEIRRVAAKTNLPYVVRAWEMADATLDRFVKKWMIRWLDVCEADAAGSGPNTRNRLFCLEDAWSRMDGLLVLAEQGNSDVLGNIERQAAMVEASAEICDKDADILLQDVAPPSAPELYELQQELSRYLAQANSNFVPKELRQKSVDAVEKAKELGYRPLIAKAHVVAGRVADVSMELKEAVPHYESAYSLALASRFDLVAFEAAIYAVYAYARLAELEKARTWSLATEGYKDRFSGLGAARFLVFQDFTIRAEVALRESKVPEALSLSREAVEYARNNFDAQSFEVASALGNVGVALAMGGDAPQAIQLLQDSAVMLEVVKGVDFPDTLTARTNLATLRLQTGDELGALFEYQRIIAASLPHVDEAKYATLAARAYNNLGTLHVKMGNLQAGIDAYTLGREIRAKQLGEHHSDTISIAVNIADALIKDGRFATAEAELRRGLELQITAVGKEHVRVGAIHDLLALALLGEGQPKAAEQEALAAVKILEKATDVTYKGYLAEANGALGRALWSDPKRRGEAVRILDRAFTLFLDLGESHEKEFQELSTWRSENGVPPYRPSPGLKIRE